MTKQILVPDPDSLGPTGEPEWKPQDPSNPIELINNVWIGKVLYSNATGDLELTG
jgi:hypothetical protein